MAISFDFKKRLGAGNFGEVWLAVDTGLNSICALKCIPKDKLINQDNFFQEAQILKLAEHPNIVRVLETGTLNDGRVYVAMEYLEKGSLEDEASGAYIHLTRAKVLMVDVLRALEYSHNKNIIHRDIKPANIMVGNAKEGKLSDFGLALPDISKLKLTSIKQYQYILHLAPEIKTLKDFSILSDIYACGVTLYRLVNGDSFLPQIPLHDVREKILAGTYPDRGSYRDFIPVSVRRVINKAMHINPDERYQSAKEMRHKLEQLNLVKNWDEKQLQNGFRWVCGTSNMYYKVKKLQVDVKKWEIETKKGKTKTTLKRVMKFCYKNLDKKQADIKVKKILQDYATGKEK